MSDDWFAVAGGGGEVAVEVGEAGCDGGKEGSALGLGEGAGGEEGGEGALAVVVEDQPEVHAIG